MFSFRVPFIRGLAVSHEARKVERGGGWRWKGDVGRAGEWCIELKSLEINESSKGIAIIEATEATASVKVSALA